MTGRVLSACCFILQLALCVANAANGSFPLLLDATLDELRQGLDSGAFSSVDLTKAYIARINEVNGQLHAVNEINPDALKIAAERDKERYNGTVGPLHGIPILIKDNIATDDKMNNTAGSFALVGARPPRDSTVAAKLRKAGAVILGKANLSQWANFRSDNGSSGWSSVGGQAIGAYFPGQDPSGSSSGSGVASSVGLAWACLGTETAGSIISPSEENNLVGIKPSVGLTSRYLVVPISEHQDTVGPMARTVKDAAHLLRAIVGKDCHDNYTSAIPFADKDVPDYVAACKTSGLQGKRIGVPRGLATGGEDSGFPAAVATAFRHALGLLRASGAVLVEDVDFPGYEQLGSANDVVLKADFVTGVRELYLKHLKTNPHNVTSLADLQAFTHRDPREGWPERDTGIWDSALALGFGNDSPQFREAYQEQLTLGGEGGLAGALKNRTLDAVFAPSGYASGLAALLGHPVVTVPMGRMPNDTKVTQNGFGNLNATAPNQPFGVAFAGDHFTEEALIGMAYALEQQTLVREKVRPIVLPKTELNDVVGK
ncbi:glutamyl-tRNA(Gln) amidotransferase subunit A [Cordyceps fumosorosea ARSEF 2679]|uniref:Glutamyl-tRNA(Gln) amidotransferase subunit A n=1 Tax=Cordyceps fumosorosea (strain ARSEF 2679) TaxID=1081104 RepID=A0A167QMF6_CORFA|nr:glutamyl-tRNA(Gln) amidotransferase subunit A [Cordyceps fumosorosea ARSEF 2679]OAA57773.1 glutamyl-tRNA(Gln) amidotransferase subunit A [Cordyceps fumosorosea ARSEF 2679]